MVKNNSLPIEVNTLKSHLKRFAYKGKGWKLICNVIDGPCYGDVYFPTTEDDVVDYLAKMSLTHNIVGLSGQFEWLGLSFDSSKDHTTNIDSEVVELVVSLVHR